jgi:serine/threonine protein kinase
MIGQRLLHYQVVEKLGEGGMGVVYKARDTHLDRFVAIKVLPPEKVSDPTRKARFIQEAKAASALNHPNIITVHDISSDDGIDFIAMEYVDGKTLDQLIPRKGMRINEALKIAVQIADALARAHSAGIIHRDLKPANIMIDSHGQVKVLDFGLAKLTEQGDPSEASTATAAVKTEEGTIAGTAAYMSPEQAEGKPLDARSDIFSFGSVLYEMVTGQRAFQGDSKMSTLAAVLQRDPSPLPAGFPPEFSKVVSRCLRKNASRRFQHVDDVHISLQELKEESESGFPAAPTTIKRSGGRGRRILWGAAAILIALSAIGISLYLNSARSNPPTTLPLTNYYGNELLPSISPDGKQVAFVWTGDEKVPNLDVYVKLVDAGSPLKLTTAEELDLFPAWSPDGRHVAFTRWKKEYLEILVVPALGGPERKLVQSSAATAGSGLTASGSKLSWSADGKWIAYVDRASPNSGNSIFLVSVETNEKRQLTLPPAGFGGDVQPAFSPDGTAVAFYRMRAPNVGDLHVLPVSGAGPAGHPLKIAEDEYLLTGPAWTADGRDLIFSSSRNSSPHTLYRVPSSGGSREPLHMEGTWPSVAASGHRLALQRSVIDSSIWRVSATGAMRWQPPERLFSSTRPENDPRYSPDGRQIAYKLSVYGGGQIWVCDNNGRNSTQLTNVQATDVGSPRWSPDGRWVVFDSLKRGRRDIYVIASAGGAARKLTEGNANNVRPSYSRDGKWIYFGSDRSGAWQIWKMPVGGGEAVQVTVNGGREAFESVDGRSLFYIKSGARGVWKMNLDGGGEFQVEKTAVQSRWAVGAKGLYVRNGFVNFLTGKWESLWELPAPRRSPKSGH